MPLTCLPFGLLYQINFKSALSFSSKEDIEFNFGINYRVSFGGQLWHFFYYFLNLFLKSFKGRPRNVLLLCIVQPRLVIGNVRLTIPVLFSVASKYVVSTLDHCHSRSRCCHNKHESWKQPSHYAKHDITTCRCRL